MQRIKKVLRYISLKVLKFLHPMEIKIKNPWTNDSLYLDIYKHKGYWFYRKKREYATISNSQKILCDGDVVFDIGGHVGFLSQVFSKSVGSSGKVFVFEPGENNLAYLRKNIKTISNISLIEKAVSSLTGKSTLYQEGYSGQNNTLEKDFKGLEENLKYAYEKFQYSPTQVDTISLDDYYLSNKKNINKISFIKIDVEGHEKSVLQGCVKIIDIFKPQFMVEITRNFSSIQNFFLSKGYQIFDDKMTAINELNKSGNYFCIYS